MAITSLAFIGLIYCSLILYYSLIPKRMQWVFLLILSCLFYASQSRQGLAFVCVTAVSIYFATLVMESLSQQKKRILNLHKEDWDKEQKKTYKARVSIKRKCVLCAALVLNFGLLCTFKYTEVPEFFSWVMPLGISFYTFQSTGYLVDVYWENVSAERNFFKELLFVSFFPQIIQGPISKFDQLSPQLFGSHDYKYEDVANGSRRLLWGFAKKLLIANMLAPCVKDVFTNYPQYSGITTLIGAFLYSVQIYADFSGYMDIMCGICEMFGIRLAENFDCPYFSKSVTEYWRRWHITLGAWFRDYVYYPIAVSGWNLKIGKWAQTRFGRHFGLTLPATISLIIVWITTGMWHGSTWAYVVWGLANGVFIIADLWFEPVVTRWKRFLHISDSSCAWKLWQIMTTFVLVTFIKVLPEVGTLSQGVGLWQNIFTNFDVPQRLSEWFPYWNFDMRLGYTLLCVGVMTILLLVFFAGSVIKFRNLHGGIRNVVDGIPFAIRMSMYALLCILILMLGFGSRTLANPGEFLYAAF